MGKTLSVIIVNYNGQRFLKGCLDALVKHLEGIDAEIIVLDNNSHDDSCAYLKANYPQVRLIESKTNLGFGAGNNEAVRQSVGDYLLLINNDTIVLDPLLPALRFLQNDPTIGAVGINMLDANERYLPVSGDFPNPGNMFRMKKIQERNTLFTMGNFTQESYEVDWLSGSFLLMPKTVYDSIGGFDEDYFLYVEDVDLCRRIANKGYKRVFLPGFRYIHFVGFNTSKNPLLVKGYELYIAKHLKGGYKWRVLAALKINKFVKMLKNRL